MSDQRFRAMLTRIRRRLVVTRAAHRAESWPVLHLGSQPGLAAASAARPPPVSPDREGGVRFVDRLLYSAGDHRDLSPRERELLDTEAEIARLAGRSDHHWRRD